MSKITKNELICILSFTNNLTHSNETIIIQKRKKYIRKNISQ